VYLNQHEDDGFDFHILHHIQQHLTTNTKAHIPKSLLITSIKMSKLITVFGATGNQGGSVIKHILGDAQLSSEFKIRGITRDVKKPAAKALADKGVELTTVSLPWISH
jgi:hypothetical protein